MSDPAFFGRGLHHPKRKGLAMFPKRLNETASEELEFLAGEESSENRPTIISSSKSHSDNFHNNSTFDEDAESVVTIPVVQEENGEEELLTLEEGEGVEEEEQENGGICDEGKSINELEILSPIKLTAKLVGSGGGGGLLKSPPNDEGDGNEKRKNKVEFVQFDTSENTTHYLNDRDDVIQAKIFSEIRNACKLSDRNRANRLAQPRMSLLGKPLNYNRGARRDARYRRLQSRVYNFLERPRGFPAVLYHVLVFLMVFTCLALSVFSTIDEYEDEAIDLLFRMEIIVVIWFTIEFVLRLWSSGCRSRYQGGIGRLRFLKRPFCIIDIITICASFVVLGMGTSGQVFATSALRGLRFFQILRMVRMDRRGGTWKLLGSVVYAHRQELITTLYIGFLGLIFASFLVYLMEKGVNDKFNNFAQALWWGVITLCTVGYGDMVPETWQGKLIASFCALLGISFFALPAGILGSGFALKVQQQQRQKHMIRRRQPAATLIQSLWRCYAADEHSVSVATWKIHQVPLPSPPPSRASSSFKHNASFVARLPTIRRHKSQSLHSPGNAAKPQSSGNASGSAASGGRPSRCPRTISDINASAENLEVSNNGRPLNPSLSEDSVAETALAKKNSDGNKSALLRIGEASALPVMLCGLLQKELFLQQQQQQQEESQESQNQVSDGENFDDDFLGLINQRYHAAGLANEDDEPRCVQLTNQHKIAIRFIRKLKYFSARKKFREALKPYDVKDVIEQYSSGHADLLNRVRNLQFRLDQILGKQGSKAKDVYASKISLASRVVKVERQVDDIESKLDTLIDLYMQDRKRFLALPLLPENPHSNNPNLPPLPPNPPGGGAGAASMVHNPAGGVSLRPKPILVEKQFSEPNSPITKTFERPVQRRHMMQRGFSDLGNRMKKRVTLSHNDQSTDNSGDVVIVVNALENEDDVDEATNFMMGGHLGAAGDVCIETECEPDVNSPKTITESSIIMMDDENEDLEEEELDIEGELEDNDTPPWDLYGEADLDGGDLEDMTENTALLRTTAAKTEIIVTPISPVSSSHNLARMEADEYQICIESTNKGVPLSANNSSSGTHSSRTMDLLKPEMMPRHRLIDSEDV